MIAIALIGYGKMGKTIENLCGKKPYEDMEVKLIVDIDNRDSITAKDLSQCDVAIEFTAPDAAEENIKMCFDANLPVVSGSTGWTKRLKEMQMLAIENDKSFLYAPNYSVGVNIFFEMNRRMAEIMDSFEDYNVMMEEIHHTEKKDAPSGTALFAAFDILERIRRKDGWKNRASDNKATLEVISKRIDDVPGTHVVKYENDIDCIELKHTAHSRLGFASGALLAAKWLVGKKGAFSMNDVLGF